MKLGAATNEARQAYLLQHLHGKGLHLLWEYSIQQIWRMKKLLDTITLTLKTGEKMFIFWTPTSLSVKNAYRKVKYSNHHIYHYLCFQFSFLQWISSASKLLGKICKSSKIWITDLKWEIFYVFSLCFILFIILLCIIYEHICVICNIWKHVWSLGTVRPQEKQKALKQKLF